MNRATWFWVIMGVWLLFELWASWRPGGGAGVWCRNVGGIIIVWVLLALLGWQVFGPAVHH